MKPPSLFYILFTHIFFLSSDLFCKSLSNRLVFHCLKALSFKRRIFRVNVSNTDFVNFSTLVTAMLWINFKSLIHFVNIYLVSKSIFLFSIFYIFLVIISLFSFFSNCKLFLTIIVFHFVKKFNKVKLFLEAI